MTITRKNLSKMTVFIGSEREPLAAKLAGRRDMQCPAEVYQPSTHAYTGLLDIDYPLHDKTIVVTRCGRICLGKKKINFSTVFAGQAVGIKEVHDDIWLVSFMDYDLGYFDLETRVLEPLENPFGPKVLPMS